MTNSTYSKAIQLLHEVATANGFLASAEATSNYNRVWARDGVICGLAALASGDEQLILTFRKTLESLAQHQHPIGTIPSNILFTNSNAKVSYGGLAGRVDAVTWYVIGVCHYAFHTKDSEFFYTHKVTIEKCFALLEALEFNNKHLLYVPLSGNWADEYLTDGYVLYDQLLRIWALKSYNHFVNDPLITQKTEAITNQIRINFLPNSMGEKYHERAYKAVNFKSYLPCAFSPSGYKTQFDAFANSLALLLNISSVTHQKDLVNYMTNLASETKLGLVPAFWPPVFENDEEWHLLKNNCKYEFRNYPYEFHNGGSWTMVNGFFGIALNSIGELEKARTILEKINAANALHNHAFYENFNTQTQVQNGVTQCAWSAAATIMVHQSVFKKFKILL